MRVSEKEGGAGKEAREVWYSARALRQKNKQTNKLFHLSFPQTKNHFDSVRKRGCLSCHSSITGK